MKTIGGYQRRASRSLYQFGGSPENEESPPPFNSRGHNKPDIFSYVDFRSVRYAINSKSIQLPVLHSHTMFLSGRTTPQMYGELVSNDRIDAMHLQMSGIAQSPGHGLLIQEIQEKLLRFLIKIAETILYDQFPLNGPIPPPMSSLLQHNFLPIRNGHPLLLRLLKRHIEFRCKWILCG